MTNHHYQQRPGISLNMDGKSSTALVWAPFAKSVAIGKDNDQRLPLTQSSAGYWEGHDLPLVHGDLYKVLLEDEPFPDPASLAQPKGVHGPSQVIDLKQYRWTDRQWRGLNPDELIIYELHTGTFTPDGTFEGISAKLPELKKLGINTIEIMPVSCFPGSRNWGYDGAYPYAVQDSYGGPAELQKLVDNCHQQGIAVILDVVYNHLGPEGNYLPKFGPYFTNKYQTPWGEAINFDDAFSDGVRSFFLENAMMWIRDFHIDGLRLDAVHAIKDFGAQHFLAEMKEMVEEFNQTSGRKHFLIAECDLNDVKYINPFEKGGYNMDAQWCDEFHHALHSLTTGEDKGYYSDFGGIGPLIKSYNHAFVYDGIYSPHRNKTFGSNTKGQPGNKFVVFAQNHDQVGNRMMGERLGQLVSFEMQKLIAAAYLLSPFTPMIFMGEEYGEHNPFLYFVSHGDAELIKNVREGRKNEFKDFMGSKEPPDPQAEETFQKSVLTPPEKRNVNQKKLFDWYRFLIDFRKNQPFWQKDARKGFHAESPDDLLVQLTLKRNNRKIFCLLNFNKENASVKLSGKILSCSAFISYGGHLNDDKNLKKNNTMTLPPESCTMVEAF